MKRHRILTLPTAYWSCNYHTSMVWGKFYYNNPPPWLELAPSSDSTIDSNLEDHHEEPKTNSIFTPTVRLMLCKFQRKSNSNNSSNIASAMIESPDATILSQSQTKRPRFEKSHPTELNRHGFKEPTWTSEFRMTWQVSAIQSDINSEHCQGLKPVSYKLLWRIEILTSPTVKICLNRRNIQQELLLRNTLELEASLLPHQLLEQFGTKSSSLHHERLNSETSSTINLQFHNTLLSWVNVSFLYRRAGI